MAVQIASGIAGTLLVHAMFDIELVQHSLHGRTEPGQWISEVAASFVLVAAILAMLRTAPTAVPYAVGFVIMAGYWWILHILREPCSYNSAQPDKYFLWNCVCACGGLYNRAKRGRYLGYGSDGVDF